MKRVVFRPQLKTFFSRCFVKFSIGFLDSTSRTYIDDVLPTILFAVHGFVNLVPLLAWFDKRITIQNLQDRNPNEGEGKA